MSKIKDILEQERVWSDKYLFESDIKRKQNKGRDMKLAIILVIVFTGLSILVSYA